jgi:hypothetical protein
MFFMILNIFYLCLGTSWASELQESSTSSSSVCDVFAVSEYLACPLFFDFSSLFSMFVVILILPLCI